MLAKREKSEAPPSLLALGDVDFDAADAKEDPKAVADTGWKRRRAGEPMKWERLPGTRGEIIAIEYDKADPEVERKLKLAFGQGCKEVDRASA